LLLAHTELDFLLGKREFAKPQKGYLRSRLNKKIKEFANTELKLLQDKGYLLALQLIAAAAFELFLATAH
jgi:hypothetical protein